MRSNIRFQVGLIGNGSWATAIAKIMTDNHFRINWLFRKEEDIKYFRKHRHAPRYLTSVRFDLRKINFYTDAEALIKHSDWVILCMPAVFLEQVLMALPDGVFNQKYVVSGVKGLLPEKGLLLNDFLQARFQLPQEKYFSITGPCHAEEVAAEKLSYITISGKDKQAARMIAGRFNTPYLNTIINEDVYGAQYAAVLKNIYAIGAGIAHGLGYGDNFLAVYIANCASEMAEFIRQFNPKQTGAPVVRNAFASAYLGDLLVTCYSQYSRNRTFGTMVGKGYSVESAQLEMNMVAEGYYAAKCMHDLSRGFAARIPIAEQIYQILWQRMPPDKAFSKMCGKFV